MEWNGQSVLVTGASGLIGSWLVEELLQQGAQVVLLLRDWDPQSQLMQSGNVQRSRVVNGCLEDYRAVERAICEYETTKVIHLGAQTIVGTALRNPLETFESNIRGTYHVLEVCRRHPDLVDAVVIASSDKAYGDAASLPYTEAMPLHGRHPYDVSKSAADLIALSYAHTYELPVCVARCGNVYGGGDLNWSRIVPGTIRSLFRNEDPIIRSDGKYTRDYIYVRDVVGAYLTLAEQAAESHVRGEAFNFSYGSPMTVLAITQSIQKLMGHSKRTPIVLNQVKAEIKDQYLDSSKSRRLLAWEPRVGLEEGLTETIRWYETFFKETGDFES